MDKEQFPARGCAWFEGAFADDTGWDANGSPSVPAGQAVSAVIAEILRRAGIEPGEAVVDLEHFAWVIEPKRDNVSVECIVQFTNTWLLLTVPHGGLFAGNKKRRFYSEVLKALSVGMNPENGFSKIVWGTRDEIADQGKVSKVRKLFSREK